MSRSSAWPGSDADDLGVLVRDYFVRQAPIFGLDPGTLTVEYVLNWGGFVNFSYRVRDTTRAFHLKLSALAEDQAALRRWMSVAPLLEPYHAPPMLAWIDLGVAAGPLFPFLSGQPPSLLDDGVVTELLPVVRRLHHDRRLAAALQPREATTAREAYLGSFHERFTADLRGIRDARPPFVSLQLLEWLEGEVLDLAERIASSSAFAEPLTTVVHGDLWLNNIIWESRDHWYILDWDDMRIGDPAADLATLLGPTAQDLRPLKLLEHVEGMAACTEQERLPLLGRATLLDWVIDPVADWVEASAVPTHAATMRMAKERIHREALVCYEALYG